MDLTGNRLIFAVDVGQPSPRSILLTPVSFTLAAYRNTAGEEAAFVPRVHPEDSTEGGTMPGRRRCLLKSSSQETGKAE